MPVDTELSTDGKTLTISVVGRFDFELVQDFRGAYLANPGVAYTIDMRGAEHMDSSALGMLLNMRKTVGDDTPIAIVNCRPQIRKILTISRFDKKFNIE